MPTPTNPKPTVFISYFRGDEAHARTLIADLDAAGHACWIDATSIRGGDEWVRKIADGIIHSYALIVLATTEALNSKWVRMEILWAKQQEKLIIPWVIEDVLKHPGFFPLVDCQGVKLSELGYEAALRKLLASLPAPALPASLDAEQAWLKRLQWEDLVNTDKYTPMGGASQRSRPEMRAVFDLLPMGRGGLRGEPRRFENAVAEIRELRRAAEKEKSEALTVLPRAEVAALLGPRLLYLAGSASLLSVGEQARFSHQLLQEYFAARFMDLEIAADRLPAVSLWPPDRWWERNNWEEAAVLLAGYHGDDCSPVVEWLADAQPEVAARCATRSGSAPLPEAVAARLREKWIPRLTDLEHDPAPKARAAIGRAVGMIGGDNRKGVGVIHDSRGIALPDIDWVEIPAGEFQYGDEGENDSPPKRLTLPAFRIARYPITNAQFQTFLDDPAGFADPRWFEGLAAREEERAMESPRFDFANHPRERVNWYQAIAFCRWLSWRLGGGSDLKKVDEWAVRLPTEFEWEKAARGTDGRSYPYEGDYDPEKGNTSPTGIGQTSAVGIFPNGASPYGVMDMSGNVWDWCLSNYDKPAMDARKENLRTDKRRVLRGGSWANDHRNARAAYRDIVHPADRNINYGFRVVG